MARLALAPLAALIVCLGGCRSRSDLVEAELRTKERELRELKGRLEQAELVNEALERDLISGHAPAPRPAVEESHAAPALTGLKGIEVARGTGGVDQDGLSGDDALQVVVTPRDEDGTAVKVVGSLRVEAFQIRPEGTKTPLSTWDVPAMQLRRTWKAGLFSSGFHLVFPWKQVPVTERLRVVAHLVLPDGRVFEADRDITIRLPAQPPRQEAFPVQPTDPSPVPPPAPIRPDLLPMPIPEGPSLSRARAAELGRPRAAAAPSP